MEHLFGIWFVMAMGVFAYVSAHLVEEKKRGKNIPFFWEKWGNKDDDQR